jgi:hypothetical protein
MVCVTVRNTLGTPYVAVMRNSRALLVLTRSLWVLTRSLSLWVKKEDIKKLKPEKNLGDAATAFANVLPLSLCVDIYII